MRIREGGKRAEKVVTLKTVSLPLCFLLICHDMKEILWADRGRGQVATGAYPVGALVTVPHDTAFCCC